MWNMLNNGVCPPQQAESGFKSIASGQTNQAAIDNAGRLYTWGSAGFNGYTGQTPVAETATSNFFPHPVIFNQQVRRPFQVGIKSNWVRVESTNSVYMAIDADGFLYCWGDGSNGVGGWGQTSKYSYSGGKYVPGGSVALVPTLVNSQVWENFSLGWSHAVGLAVDGTLWIWGENTYGYAYGSASYTNGFISLVPIQMTWVPGPVKLVCADDSVTAIVTENNEVWIWGYFNINIYAVPTKIDLTLPAGTSIVKMACSNDGVIVLLSNGRAYCMGDTIVFNPTTAGSSATFVAEPDNHNFVDVDLYGNKASGIDVGGNLWAWGNMIYLVWVAHDTIPGECDYQHYLQYPTLAMAETLGQYRWQMISLGGWTYVGVDDAGDLFTNGENAYSELGIGLTETEHDHECYPIKTLPLLLDDGTASGILATGGETTAAIQILIASPKQLSEHNPCGHWHKGLDAPDDAGGLTIPECCWNFAVDISGNDVVLYGLAKTYPWATIALRYNTSTRVWYGPYWRKDNLYTQEWLAGASINGAFEGLSMYCGDIFGTEAGGTVTEERITVKTTYHPTSLIVERHFYGMPPQNCEGKIVVSATGTVAAIFDTGSSVQLWFSNDYGVTYILGETWTHTGQYKYARIVRDGSTYYVGIFYADGLSNGQIKTYRSTDGTTWTATATVSVHIDAIRFNMFASANTVYLLCYGQLFFSTDSATSFTSRNTTDPTSFGVANGAEFDALMFYMRGLERTFDYNATDPIWVEYPKIPIIRYEITDSTTVRGSGNNVVYMRDNVFIDKKIALPVSISLGEFWDVVPTPINYYETPEDAFHGRDDPRWKFSQQPSKVAWDPQYI